MTDTPGVANTVTGAVSGLVQAHTVHGGVRMEVGVRVARSAYLEQVRRIAPAELRDRDAELAELADFCLRPDAGGPAGTGREDYVWWRASAWAGKSALLAWFVLHPPARVRVVSFFVTARFAGQSDRVAFADVVLEQLADLLDCPMPAYLTDATREAHLLRLLDQAAQTCRRAGQRLVLIVDGLDEDLGWTTSADAHSVAALLPARPPDGLRIVVAGRPDPPLPADVPADHPLHDPAVVRRLTPSSHAQVIKHEAQRELRRLLNGTATERRVLGLVVAAGGGLSGPDLAELTGYGPQEIEDCLRAVSGRSFRRHPGRWRTDTSVYLLGHEELQRTARGYFGPEQLEHYRQQLHGWAERYRADRWPPETPEYLLRSYLDLLQSSGDVARMVVLATDPERHDRMLAITGGDSIALAEIGSTQEAVLARDGADLATMARLAVHRDTLRQRNSHVPCHLVTVWARLGHVRRAEALARSMEDSEERAHALCSIAQVAADAGDLDHAEQLALSITDPNVHITAVLATATAAGDAGDLDRARGLVDRAGAAADVIPEQWRRMRAWVRLAQHAAQVGDHAAFDAFADHAETAARSLTDPFPRQQELVRMAEEMARAGDFDRAERLADSAVEPYGRALLFGRIAQAAARIGDNHRSSFFNERAVTLATSLPDPRTQATALAVTAQVAAQAGDGERAEVLTRQAATAARAVAEPEQRVWVLAWTAQALSSAGGRTDRIIALVDEAESIARSISDASSRSSALQSVAAAAGRVDINRAQAVIESMDSADAQTSALTDLVQVAATGGEVERAARLARVISEPYQRVQMLAVVADAAIHTGHLDRAMTLATEAESTARLIVAAESRAESLAVLTNALIQVQDLGRAATFAAQTATYATLITFPGARTRVHRAIAEAMIRVGDDHQAETFARANEDPHTQAQLIPAVAQAMARSGHDDRAEALALSIADPLSRIQTLTRLASDLADGGNLDRARALVHTAEAAASSVEQPHLQATAQSHLTEAMAHVGELDKAQAGAYSIPDPCARAHALAAVAEILFQAGLLHRAVTLLEDAEEAAFSITDANLLVETLADIAQPMSVVGGRERLGPLADRAEVAARSAPAQMQAQLLAVVAVVAAQAGDLDQAEELARTDTNPSWESHARTLATAAEAMVRAGGVDRAERLASSISTNWRSLIQLQVVKAMSMSGNASSAERLARSITDSDLQAEALATVAAAVDLPEARRLLAQALHLGEWARAVPVLAQVQPDVVIAVSDDVASLVQRRPPGHTVVSGVAYKPTLRLES